MNILKRVQIATLLFLLPVMIFAQHTGSGKARPRVMKFNAETSVMINELGMVVSEEDGKARVAFIAPKERRSGEAVNLDIESGDEVGMANGKAISSVKELRAAYESAKVGDLIKLGLRRDGRARIVTFKKKAEPERGQRRMVVRRDGGGDESTDVLPALGIAIEQRDEGVIVTGILPDGPEEFSKGDVIAMLNGKEIKTIVDFSKVYDRAEEGDELKFTIMREGKKISYVTKREKPQGIMKVKVK